jgi:hypothetical protein
MTQSMGKISKAVATIKNYQNHCTQLKMKSFMCVNSQHPKLKNCVNEIISFNEKLITNIPEGLPEPLMKVAYTTFEQRWCDL